MLQAIAHEEVVVQICGIAPSRNLLGEVYLAEK